MIAMKKTQQDENTKPKNTMEQPKKTNSSSVVSVIVTDPNQLTLSCSKDCMHLLMWSETGV